MCSTGQAGVETAQAPTLPPLTSLKQLIRGSRIIDVTDHASDLGFSGRVGVTRRAFDRILLVWSSCACTDCEEGARNATRDRVERMLKALQSAVAGRDDDQLTVVTFTLDVPTTRRSGLRRVWTLQARLAAQAGGAVVDFGEDNAPDPDTEASIIQPGTQQVDESEKGHS